MKYILQSMFSEYIQLNQKLITLRCLVNPEEFGNYGTGFSIINRIKRESQENLNSF